MHWADVLASQLEEDRPHVIATGITPSGPIHIGNMREILTADAVYRAALDRNLDVELIYVADDFDPLRRVYPFLTKEYENYVGMPLSEIPCPCKEHRSYADHFLENFLKALEELGIKPKVYRASNLYKEGKYEDFIKIALEKSEEIKGIIEEISKRDLPRSWIPFNVLCENCKRLTSTQPLLYEYPKIEYKCSCGYEGEADIRKSGAGKLPWRVDWPARWKMLKVTFEPFGKDHAAAGSSWDTGKLISERIFGYPPPHHVVYEFIQLKGKGAMHSSKGIAISAEEMLSMTPPEVLRFLIMKNKPSKHIDFDPGLGLLDLVDEYDDVEKVYFEVERKETDDLIRIYELSQPYKIPEKLPLQIPYRHLAIVVQITRDWDGILKILKRSGQLKGKIEKSDEERLRSRVKHVTYWLDRFAPERIKFKLQEKFPDIKIVDDQKRFLKEYLIIIRSLEWNAEELHEAVYTASNSIGIDPKVGFKTMYQILLNKEYGPRLGYFLAILGKEFVIKRMEEAIK